MSGTYRHPAYKHGHTKHHLFRTWLQMLNRCHNPRNPQYKDYGKRGITVCIRWRESFEAFCKDMGDKPEPSMSIDRVDNDKGYTKQNTRWATRKQQSTNNRSNRWLEYMGERWRLCDLAEYVGIAPTTLASRIDRAGMSVSDAVEKPLNQHKSPDVYKKKAAELGISPSTLRCRVKKHGWLIAITSSFTRGRPKNVEKH
ncbi:hypothetical protein [Photobacterium gaetbulicola]|uniref:hypothetical protein n=1 Tax=Photobacterium gaetbulicola TaxID=1295392 RepID=UPI0018CE0161|nr:hypothetical protein [Photobacterium gaetbulicola]